MMAGLKWRKLGHIFAASGQYDYMQTHAGPVNVVVMDDRIRVFFSTRRLPDADGNYVTLPTYVDVDRKDPTKVLRISERPIFTAGGRGCFDEFGVMIYKSVVVGGKLFLFYGGWNRLTTKQAPYQVLLGLAVSSDGERFERYSDGPVMGTDIYDPLSIGNVFIVPYGDGWLMYYTTYKRWEFDGVRATPEYNIKIAYSADCIHWQKKNEIAVDEDEKGGVATPCVFDLADEHIMLFGYRLPYLVTKSMRGGVAGPYKIGAAVSNDLLSWSRDDTRSGIAPSDSGWDKDMVCYPHVINVDGRYLMFYCGNGFGASGFGAAELEGCDI